MRISYKNLKRYKEIAHVLIKYGFSVIVEKLNIEEVAYKIPITNPSEEIKNMSTATKIRCVIEELGPTYIKFGQLLSTRKDLFDQDIIDELSKLRDSVEPFDTDLSLIHTDAADDLLCVDLGGRRIIKKKKKKKQQLAKNNS